MASVARTQHTPRISDKRRVSAATSCATPPGEVCGPPTPHQGDGASLIDRIAEVLADHGVTPLPEDVSEFADVLAYSNQHRINLRSLTRGRRAGHMDILHFIGEAQRAGDRDEALWRAFLAAHFGHMSENPEQPEEYESAGRFLCGFGSTPMWTWKRVSGDILAFSSWLRAHTAELATLRYGNHRKFESKKPDDIAAVVGSFVAWVQSRGGSPSAAFVTPDKLSPQECFHALYDAFKVYHFGRLGRFDFLCLLGDLDLLPIEPDSCYISESTGPLRGAQKLCGQLDPRELGSIADELARALGVSPVVVEDALCMWQKS